jgi:hypothetical protein
VDSWTVPLSILLVLPVQWMLAHGIMADDARQALASWSRRGAQELPRRRGPGT